MRYFISSVVFILLCGSTALSASKELTAAQKLRSPRDTVQTLYYAIDVYEFSPPIIADATSTLDLGDTMPADSASAALLAVQLECVLNSLDLPLGGIPDQTTENSVTIYEADQIKITLQKNANGFWKFDRATVERIPAMWRIAVARQKNLMAEARGLARELHRRTRLSSDFGSTH